MTNKQSFHRRHARQLFILGISTLLLGLFLKLSSELLEGEVDALDQAILTHVMQWRTDALTSPVLAITALGSPPVLTLFAVLGLLFFLFRRKWHEAAYLAAGAAAIPLCTVLAKQIFSRPRPPAGFHLVNVTSFSYPSGHTGAASVLYLLLAFLICRYISDWRLRGAIMGMALVMIAAVGFTRIYLGVHYPSDVLSGFLLGSGWVLFLTALLEMVRGPFESGGRS